MLGRTGDSSGVQGGASAPKLGFAVDMIVAAAILVVVSGTFFVIDVEALFDPLTGPHSYDSMIGTVVGILAAVCYLAFRDRGRLMAETRRRQRAEAELAANEQRFRDYAEVSSDWFWGLDRDLRFSFLSAGTEQRTGENPDNMMGSLPSKDGLLDVSDEAWAAHIADLRARRPVVDFRFGRVDREGRLRHFSVSAKPIYDGHGAFAGYRGTGRDITERVEARRFLRQVIDALPAVVAVRDRESRYVLVNSAFARLCGTTQKELIGKPLGTVFGPEAGARVRARDLAVLETGAPTQPQEIRLAGKDDEIERIWLNQLVPIRDAAGTVGAVLSIGVDITAQKETEAAILWTQERLRESEQRFRDFAETASDWFWEQDENLRFSFISSGNMRLSNMSAEAHYGKTRRETNPLDVSDEQWAAHEAALAAHSPFADFRFSRIASDGSKRYLTISGVPLFDAAGRFRGYRGTGRDMTALVEAEKRLRDSEQRFRDFAEAASDIFWEMDKDLRLRFMSDSVEAVTGFPARAYVGRTNLEIAPDDPARQATHVLLEERRTFRDRQFSPRAADGSTVHLSYSGKPIYSADGEFLGYRGITRDMTAQREAEEEAARLRQARDLAAVADLAKSRFLAHMSHELRTPLNAILGFAELMLAELFGPLGADNYRNYMKDIQNSGQHLLGIINDLLDKSRIELGQFTLAAEDVEVAAVVQAAVRIARGASKADQANIHLDPIDPAWAAHVDRRVIRQVLVNLLSNASKFTPREGLICVSVAGAAGGALQLRVVDTGAGIEPDRIAKVFEPFQHQDAVRARKGQGAGLGLWLSRSLVELHGGTLVLESRLGEGTAATVTLPANRIVAGPALHADRLWSEERRRTG
ncbi:MAG: PAS domain S-box protein [Alphaproteobacteria bacterium]|nr:PAS domain S-box protein [Alphaproteobacteria bacterium]